MSVEIGLGTWVNEAMLPILKKFEERIDGDLSKNDVLAAYSAVSGALAVGLRQGIASAVFEIETQVKQQGSDFTVLVHVDLPDYDPWFEEYGE